MIWTSEGYSADAGGFLRGRGFKTPHDTHASHQNEVLRTDAPKPKQNCRIGDCDVHFAPVHDEQQQREQYENRGGLVPERIIVLLRIQETQERTISETSA